MTALARRAVLAVLFSAGAAAGYAAGPCADWVPQPKPQNASRDVVGKDLDEIVERGWIEFGLYENFAPWSWDDHGTVRGIDVDIARLIAESLGVESRFRLVASAETLEADLMNWVWKGPVTGGQVVNVLMHVPVNPEFSCRVEQVVFTGQAYRQGIAIAYDEAAYPEEKPVPAYFRFDTVGVENDSISDFYLTTLLGGQVQSNVHRYPSTVAAVAGLGRGEVKAAMGPQAELEWNRPEGVAVHAPPLPGFGAGQWTLGVGVSFHYRPLAYAVDDAIAAAIADGRMAAIFAGYGVSWLPPDR